MIRKIWNLKTLYILLAIIAIGFLLVPRIIMGIQLHLEGISYIASNTEQYYQKTFPVEGTYTVEIDMSDLESNEGKVLFEDGQNEIYVSKVTRTDSEYKIVFRSKGSYETGGAMLISGLEHVRNNSGLSSDFVAEAVAEYKDESYPLSPSGSSNLKYPDGDQFGFATSTPIEGLDVKEASELKVTITHLQVNLWAEKPDM